MLKFHKTLKINILIILKIILTTEVVICSALLFDFYVLPNQHTFDLIEGHRSSYGGSRQGKFSSSESNLSYLGEKVKTKKGLQFKLEGELQGYV